MIQFAASLRVDDPKRAVARAAFFLDCGYESLLLEDPLHHRTWVALRDMLPPRVVAGIRMFLPYPSTIRPDRRLELDFETDGRDDRSRLVDLALETMRVADDQDIQRVLLPVIATAPSEERSPLRGWVLDTYLGILDAALQAAERYQREICITPSCLSREFPGTDELETCFREFEGAPLSLWLDAPRSEGLEFSEGRLARLRGMSMHDAKDDDFGLLPGNGDVDWESIDPLVRKSPIWCLDLRSGTDDEFQRGRAFFESRVEGPSAGGEAGTFFFG